MKLVVGLGNPGSRYALTRHNIGARAVSSLVRSEGFPAPSEQWKSQVWKGKINGESVSVLVPRTYMNASGEAVKLAVASLGCSLEDVLIVFDEVQLPVGQLRIRPRGSDGGHRGLRSVLEHMGSHEVSRLRIGVGSPDDQDLETFVLEPFRSDEESVITEAVERAINVIQMWVGNEMAEVQAVCNPVPEETEL